MGPAPAASRGGLAFHAPLLLEPAYFEKPWGGRRLADELGRRGLPDGPVGESWEVADLPEHRSRVQTGPHAGRTLGEVWGSPYPLLVKVLDAREDLSVQLHPDEQAASERGDAAVKEEAWVALADGGEVALLDGALDDVGNGAALLERMRRVPLRRAGGTTPPTAVHVPPGTVHAILGGSLLVEVQNPVDVTWRLYDHGRVGLDGLPRALHTAEAAPVLRRGPREPARVVDGGRTVAGRRFRIDLVTPGATRLPPSRAARVLVPLGRARATTDGGTVAVERARAIVLPGPSVTIEAVDWCVLASAS
ncbi:MAG: type I phosphomannose isomerase catalytic subunit [Planctomycetota bacterium]